MVEKMLVRRLRYYILPKSNPRQYGFVPQKSTEDALYDLVKHIRENLMAKKINVVVSLDIEGAFDSAWWPAIKLRLAEKKCPANLRAMVNDYLNSRSVTVRYAGKAHTKETTIGCVQGSIAGPTFWNVLLDSLLDDMTDMEVHSQAFADDVVLVFSGHRAFDIETNANRVLAHVQEWGKRNKLKFAAHKTQAMLITNKLKYDTPRVHMDGVHIQYVNEMRVLGLYIDNKLTFNKHTSYICKKATSLYSQLARTAKISWGLSSEIIKTIYVAVIEPIVLYASSVWAQATEKICVRKVLNAVQRGFAQKICRAYRTTSLEASLLLTGLLPLDLRVKEVAKLYLAKRGFPQDDLIKDRQVELQVNQLEREHPAKDVEFSYTCLENTSPETLTYHNVSGPQIYTDGSRLEDRVGCAFSCWCDEREVKFAKYRLESYCTVFQAEMFGLLQAVRYAVKAKLKEANIMSDSRSSLDLLKSGRGRHPLEHAINEQLRISKQLQLNIRFFWVRAHVGTEGNERADQLAKAALKDKTTIKYDVCPLSHIKKILREETVGIWNARYTSTEKAKTTKLFFPDVIEAHKVIKNIKLSPLLTQALTGHGGFLSYLYRFKLKDSPICVCKDSDETVEHLITACPMYGYDRIKLETDIGTQLTVENLKHVIRNKNQCDKFISYCLNIVKTVNHRNKTR